MFYKIILALISYKGLKKMENNFNNVTDPQGTADPKSAKKSGVVWKIILMLVLSLLVLSPIDALPDVVPVVGWVDDVAYVAGIIGSVVSMLRGKRNQQIPGANVAQGYIPPMYNEVSSNRKKQMLTIPRGRGGGEIYTCCLCGILCIR